MFRAAGLLPILLLLAACASTGPEHENFKRVMDRQVGKSIDDRDAYPVFYRLRQLNTKQLPNGNTQQQYAAGRNGGCTIGFEIAPGTRQIVRWSIEGKDRDCVIEPRS